MRHPNAVHQIEARPGKRTDASGYATGDTLFDVLVDGWDYGTLSTSNSLTGSFTQGNDYVVYNNVVVGANGVITFSYAGNPFNSYQGDFNGLQLVSVSVPGYSDTGLANGTTYYYEVSAVNSNGESVNSSEISTKPVVPPSPYITGISLGGTILKSTATNGSAGATCYLLTSTNLALPLGQWTPVLTNTFDGNGNLSLTANVVNPTNAHEFYILQLP